MDFDMEAKALAYFRPPPHYFWHWAENGEVIEWKDGPTICFRDELMVILSGLASQDQAIPSLGTLLLLLAAGQESWEGPSGGREALAQFQTRLWTATTGIGVVEWERTVKGLNKAMELVHSLPRALRSGSRKTHLAHEVFSASTNPVPADLARLLLDEFGSGRLDARLTQAGEDQAGRQFLTDSARFILALRAYPDARQLEMKLKTGIDRLPQPAEGLLSEGADLLEILSEDPRTAGIANLTRRLLAALNFPMHAQGTSDLPLGGVSDLTNRGNFDRLLLSELANDDMLLTARLVNQEALYLRREKPPAQPDLPRTILMDTTLKMWGLPRVFALAAALACAQPKKPRTAIRAYSLGGKDFRPLDLATKEGVMESLERLETALHCEEALKSFLHATRSEGATQIILIAGEEWDREGRLPAVLADARQAIQCLLTVSRAGELRFYALSKGSRRLVSACRVDLDKLLSTPVKKKSHCSNDPKLPAFLGQIPAPLYFPTSGMNLKKKNYVYDQRLGMLAITDTGRVLYWPSGRTGARELLPYIENGRYCFGSDGESHFYITVHEADKGFLKFYRLNTQEEGVEEMDFSPHVDRGGHVVYHEKFFYLIFYNGYASIDCTSGEFTGLKHSSPPVHFSPGKIPPLISLPDTKRLINNGYTVLQRVKRLYVNAFGKITLDQHCLELIANTIRFSESRKDVGGSRCARVVEDSELPGNALVCLRRAVWADGSEAVVDSRGLLHLRSSHAAVPEITLVLILGKATAGWASDGSRFGSFYFTGVESDQCVRAGLFYSKYIQNFIDQLS